METSNTMEPRQYSTEGLGDRELTRPSPVTSSFTYSSTIALLMELAASSRAGICIAPSG